MSRPTLRQLLDQLKPHHMWLRDRIPVAWVATLEDRFRRHELIASSVGAVFVGWLVLQAFFVLVTGTASGEIKLGGSAVLAGFVLFLSWGFWRTVKDLVRRSGKRPG